jgi:hypothetical protein
MNNETKPQAVDVLAVMERAESVLWGINHNGDAEDTEKARAAVAELVKADREYDEARESLDNARNTSAGTECWNRLIIAKKKRAAALARIGGAA